MHIHTHRVTKDYTLRWSKPGVGQLPCNIKYPPSSPEKKTFSLEERGCWVNHLLCVLVFPNSISPAHICPWQNQVAVDNSFWWEKKPWKQPHGESQTLNSWEVGRKKIMRAGVCGSWSHWVAPLLPSGHLPESLLRPQQVYLPITALFSP